MKMIKGIKLKYIISILILFVILSTLVIDWLISMNSYEDTLSENHLDSNYNYVQKLKTTASHQLNYMIRNINSIGKDVELGAFTQENLDNWYEANHKHFNMLIITDDEGTIELISPEKIVINEKTTLEKGVKLEGELIERALQQDEPTISFPGRLMNNQLTTLVSSPIYDRDTNEVSGMIAGVIFLESDNVLKCIFGNHQYDDSSYVYVVDRHGKLIYHPDEKRLEEDVSQNEVVQKVLKREDGSQIVKNSRNVEFYASYAYLEVADWGIVVQTKTEVIEEPLSELFWRIIMLTLPVILIILFMSSYIVSRITKPLHELAAFSEKAMEEKDVTQDISKLNIKTFIYEVQLLYKQVVEHISMLNKQAVLDGLTKVANRRKFDIEINRLFDQKIPFSLIMIDIDYFKKVNDTYGHMIGDKVLQFIAAEMESIVQRDDLVFRYGGEEFGILLKKQAVEEAYDLAKKLQLNLMNKESPTGEPITISIGITNYHENDTNLDQIINRADAALYESKRLGRNRITVREAFK